MKFIVHSHSFGFDFVAGAVVGAERGETVPTRANVPLIVSPYCDLPLSFMLTPARRLRQFRRRLDQPISQRDRQVSASRSQSFFFFANFLRRERAAEGRAVLIRSVRCAAQQPPTRAHNRELIEFASSLRALPAAR
jgi:hypothetical protein